MMTSNFANIRNLRVFASISLYPPSWYVGPDFKTLAPTPELFHAKGISNEEYRLRYERLVLDKLDPLSTYNSIVEKYGNDIVLLCFEKPGDFCHRRIVAEWFETHLGVIVPEWVKPERKTSLVF